MALAVAFGICLDDLQGFFSNDDLLIGFGIAIADTKSPIEKKNVKANEANNGPCAKRIEDCGNDQKDQSNESYKAREMALIHGSVWI